MNLFLIAPALVLLSEAVALPACRKSPLPVRLLMVPCMYLGWVLLASVLCIHPDEFGFCIIPLMTITVPWYFLPGVHQPVHLIGSIAAGAGVISAALALLACGIGYADNSRRSLANRET